MGTFTPTIPTSMSTTNFLAAPPSLVKMAVPWNYEVLDTSDSVALASAINGCDALVHTAIANDFQNLDAGAAYRAYPGLTHAVTSAAVAVGAKPIYISTDWVMDGSSHKVPDSRG